MQDTKLVISPDQLPGPALKPGAEAARGTPPERSLTVNGETRSSTAATLLDLVGELGYGSHRVATAVNGEFVPERMRAEHRLAAGDAIEIVAPRQGG